MRFRNQDLCAVARTSGTILDGVENIDRGKPSPGKIAELWPAAMVMAFSHASPIRLESVPDRRMRRLPDASQKAKPNLIPGRY